MKNITDDFVSYLIELNNTDFPIRIKEKAKECILDYIGCAFAGAKVNRSKFISDFEKNGKCSIIGFNCKTDSRTAAFINGFNAHTVELDDGNRFGMIHLGASIISALIAAAQEKNIPYDNLIKGVIIGYEVGVRLSLAMQPGHKKRGFHTSGTCGTIAAAASLALALDCNAQQLKSAISAAATSASGLLEIQENSSELKPYNLGHAAMSGLNAAYVGMLGFDAPNDILNGNRGMFRLLSDTLNTEMLTEKKDFFEIERIYVKPYAACRHCHSAIEAAIHLKNTFNIPISDIEKIQVDTYSLAIKGHNHQTIDGISSAKLSIPFGTAVAYINGHCGPEDYNESTILNRDILDLTDKIVIYESTEFSAQASQKRIAEISIFTKDGQILKHRVDYAKGDPENPMSREEIINKFSAIMDWSGFENIKNEIIKNVFN